MLKMDIIMDSVVLFLLMSNKHLIVNVVGCEKIDFALTRLFILLNPFP